MGGAGAEDGEKKFKTLTRVRQYVNEAGQVVKVQTTRVVETALASGAVPQELRSSLGENWHVKEQKRVHILRKQQQREMRHFQRDQLLEANALAKRLQADRDGAKERQDKDAAELEKEHDKAVTAHQKQALGVLDKMDKTQSSAFSLFDKTMRAKQAREVKAMQSEFALRLKTARSELAKSDKQSAKARLQQMEEQQGQELQRLHVRHSAEFSEELRAFRGQQRAERFMREKDLMTTDQRLVLARFQALKDLDENQLLERHQMLKHQLKATFQLRKQQMMYLHDKEFAHLQQFHDTMSEVFEERLAAERKMLPKRLREESHIRRRVTKRSVINKSELKPKLQELEQQELRRHKAETAQMLDSQRQQKESHLRAQITEAEELRQIHNSKKQQLSNLEATEMRNLEQAQMEELRAQRQLYASRRADLDAEFTSQACKLQQTYEADETSIAQLDLVSST